MSVKLIFLKLGGSLVTDKAQPHTPRLQVIERLAGEIAAARAEDMGLRILLGHGSGSFGHFPASQYKTRLGVKSAEEWRGFMQVWRAAAGLNHLVMQALERAGLPALVFPPSAMVITQVGKVASWDLDPLRQAIDRGLLPVIYGDVVFDTQLGGTILSTEDLLAHLAGYFQPARLLLAGSQPGVWADFPENTRLLPEITPASYPHIGSGLSGSTATDVTGGMSGKVRQVISMLEAHPGLCASIFSGEVSGNLRRALLGEALGTQVHG